MALNDIVGIALLAAAFICLLIAAAVAIRQYVAPAEAAGGADPLTEVVKEFFSLLKAMLTAPPAAAFLVGSLLFAAAGIYILIRDPI
jgi:hypothetical protein